LRATRSRTRFTRAECCEIAQDCGVTATVFRRAGLLRYAAIQFLVLVAAAMAVYAGGNYWNPSAARYELTHNFLSDLGMTHAWSGRASYASSALFFIALASVGVALIMFTPLWRQFAHARGRATFAGRASAALGTASGLAFVGVACTPFDLALMWHNAFVLAAFGLLLGYVIALTIVMATNGASSVQNALNGVYVLLVVGYVALIFFGPRLSTPRGHEIQVIGQKIIALGSMLHVIGMTTLLRRFRAGAATGPAEGAGA
jgi:hypothetical protein